MAKNAVAFVCANPIPEIWPWEAKEAGVKIVAAEFNFDGSRLTFLFSTESEEKVDLKSLKKDMGRKYPKSQIEMRQIGPRDVAKIIGGMGACGLETRCCSKFLTDFSPISIKMAKEQGISHLLEHMLFKGTTKRSAKEISVFAESKGTIIDGFTSKREHCGLCPFPFRTFSHSI
jgi:hypothetical protein